MLQESPSNNDELSEEMGREGFHCKQYIHPRGVHHKLISWLEWQQQGSQAQVPLHPHSAFWSHDLLFSNLYCSWGPRGVPALGYRQRVCSEGMIRHPLQLLLRLTSGVGW
jgi:hypothetical protein